MDLAFDMYPVQGFRFLEKPGGVEIIVLPLEAFLMRIPYPPTVSHRRKSAGNGATSKHRAAPAKGEAGVDENFPPHDQSDMPKPTLGETLFVYWLEDQKYFKCEINGRMTKNSSEVPVKYATGQGIKKIKRLINISKVSWYRQGNGPRPTPPEDMGSRNKSNDEERQKVDEGRPGGGNDEKEVSTSGSSSSEYSSSSENCSSSEDEYE